MISPHAVKEVNLAFLPIEERVFSLDNPNAYNDYYGGKMTEQKLEEIAEQLVSHVLLGGGHGRHGNHVL